MRRTSAAQVYGVPDAVQREAVRRRAGIHQVWWRLRLLQFELDARMVASFFVYILASKRNGTLYIGVTNNLARRIAEHKAKLVPGFTRQYGVDRLVYMEAFDSVHEARASEHALKRWRRAWKIELIEKLNPEWRDLTDQLNS